MPWFKKTPSEAPAVADGTRPAVESPDVEPLTEDEIAWVRSTIAELAEQDVRAGDIDDLGRHYDELLAAWLHLREADRPDPGVIISQIGLAFGQYVADHAGLDWGVATSAQGAEIVVHRPGSGGQVLLYPAEMVAQRWDAQDTRMLPALARATIEAVRKIP